MPQIIVDTATESPASLSLISRLLQDYAIMKAKDEQQAAHEYPARESDAPIAHAGSDMRGPLPPLVEIPVAPGAPVDEQDPAKLFAANKSSNVLPFPPATAAIAPIAVAPVAVLTDAQPAADASAVASVEVGQPVTGVGILPGTVIVPGGHAIERDAAGVPWDGRIHSSAKGKKQDGTWKLMRGVDKSLVTMVLHEITPKPHVVAGVIVPPGTVAAVATPVAPPLVPSVPFVPVAPAAGLVPVGPAAVSLNPVQQFQAFMQAVTAAQAAGTLTQTQVLEAVKAEGVPQLQLLITNPDKIALVKARLGLV